MRTEMFTTPEGYTLTRPLLLPEAKTFGEVLTYVREWSHEEMTACADKVARPDLVPAPRMIGNNQVGPFCTIDSRQAGQKSRSVAITATDAVMEVLCGRIVTDDDRLSFKVIVHDEHDGKPSRALIVADHSRIIGSHWLAYIDSDSLPAYPFDARDAKAAEICKTIREHTGWHPTSANIGNGARKYGYSGIQQEGAPFRRVESPVWTHTVYEDGTVRELLPLPNISTMPPYIAPRSEIKSVGRSLPNGSYIKATLTIRHPASEGLSAGFSLTGDIWWARGNKPGRARMEARAESDVGGAIGEEIVRAFPSLAPFAALHLSDLDGTPYAGVSNAVYFLSGEAERREAKDYGIEYAKRNGDGYTRACRVLRVKSIPDVCLTPIVYGTGEVARTLGYKPNGSVWHTFIAECREAWSWDAWDARRVFDALPGEES